MVYKIKDITDLNGITRTDGRYPLRIGRTGEFMCGTPMIGECLLFYYLTHSDGSEYDRFSFLRTSTVLDYAKHRDNTIVVRTINSIYKFERCDNKRNGMVNNEQAIY